MNSSRCAACKHLRRRCPSDCIFSPYFPSNNPTRFAFVHKIYGASNVAKLLQDLPPNRRAEAAESLWYEARLRIKDPVYGCVGVISVLQQQIQDLECQLTMIQAQIAALVAQSQSNETHHYMYQMQGVDYEHVENVGSNLLDWLD
ncbi:LOB domain-containing protein 23 [Striga hermonthica]|uniref:LOB domain-containing protein 23 n=1 Tax=Striga hermonthica TaxID=68872 RepID=A0A9N7RJ27_STRHE|nr:LOB domain-containing protein 23 [Striga hermonthica]